MSLPETYQRALYIPKEQVCLFDESANIDLIDIKTGILFIMARWSGQSQVAFRTLNLVFDKRPNIDVKLYIADIDFAETNEFFQKLETVSSGAGETFWIRDGKIIHELANYNNNQLQTIIEFTANLFHS